MVMTAEEIYIDDWIRNTLISQGIKKNSKSYIEYERSKEIIKEYYPDHYDRGIKIAMELIGL